MSSCQSSDFFPRAASQHQFWNFLFISSGHILHFTIWYQLHIYLFSVETQKTHTIQHKTNCFLTEWKYMKNLHWFLSDRSWQHSSFGADNVYSAGRMPTQNCMCTVKQVMVYTLQCNTINSGPMSQSWICVFLHQQLSYLKGSYFWRYWRKALQ